jgi:hypothetical protein
VILAEPVGETVIVGSGDPACGGSSSGSTCRHPQINGKKMSSRAMIPAITALVRDRAFSGEVMRVRWYYWWWERKRIFPFFVCGDPAIDI